MYTCDQQSAYFNKEHFKIKKQAKESHNSSVKNKIKILLKKHLNQLTQKTQNKKHIISLRIDPDYSFT